MLRQTVFNSHLGLLVVLLMSVEISAQVTVQLPSYRVTGISTTVLVPDRGGAYLGGVTSSSIGSSTYGSPLGRGLPGLRRKLGRSTTVGGFSMNATIIDHAELDRAVLAEAERRQRAGRPVAQAPAPHAKNRLQLAAAETASDSERVSLYLSRAKRAEVSGQPEIARVFYRRIAKHGTADQRRRAKERLAAIESERKL